jgi:hypothetical protein
LFVGRHSRCVPGGGNRGNIERQNFSPQSTFFFLFFLKKKLLVSLFSAFGRFFAQVFHSSCVGLQAESVLLEGRVSSVRVIKVIATWAGGK